MNETTRKLQEMLAQREDSELIEGETGVKRATPPSTDSAEMDVADYVSRPYAYTGRGPTGRLRNFKAMSDDKFYREAATIRSENNDPEAIEAVNADQARREA